MPYRKLLYAILITGGAGGGGICGLAASMWGGTYVILPFCIIVGTLLGFCIAYLVDLFTR